MVNRTTYAAASDSDDTGHLLALVIATFLLTADEVKQMGEAIYAARLAALTSSYTQSAGSNGITVPDGWEPPDAVMSQMADESTRNASSIAQTYQHDLTLAGAAFLANWQDEHPGDTVEGARSALTQHLGQWTAQRADWKAEQIASWETKQATKAATDQLVAELQDGTALDSA
ncbi:MAG: hypothetical protein ACRDHE_01230, partial [Ktedonobacterales bacterium]